MTSPHSRTATDHHGSSGAQRKSEGDTTPTPELPLTGIRVLDLTRALAGPFCTTLLADLGADVIKVESPLGDVIRGWGPFSDETSLYHLSVNRNKRSIVVDGRTADGQKLLRTMVSHSDVMVENFRRGVLDEIGIGKTWTDANAPHTLAVAVSGYGPTGPLASSPAFDQIAQGMAGLMSITGPVGGPATRVGLPGLVYHWQIFSPVCSPPLECVPHWPGKHVARAILLLKPHCWKVFSAS